MAVPSGVAVRGGGRRTGTVLGGPGLCEEVADPAAWSGLRSLIRMRTERTGPCGRRQRAVRYYTFRRPVDATALTSSAATSGGPLGARNGRHRTLDMQFRENDCRMRKEHALAVMGILRRAALNRLRTLPQNFSAHVSIGLLRDRIGRQPWILASALP